MAMKYLIHDTMPCYVTWTYEVEATNEDEARQKYIDGDHAPSHADPTIGDCLDWAGGQVIEVECDPLERVQS